MIKRRQYLVKKKFQLGLLAIFIALIIAESILIAAFLMYAANNTLTTGYANSTLRIERTTSFFFVSTALIMLIVLVGIGLAGLVLFVLFSHRLAGPLYRFEKTLRQIEGGDLTARINLRKTDQLMEMKEAFNSLTRSLDAKVGKIKADFAEIERALTVSNDPHASARILEILKRLKEEIRHFKVTSSQKE
jgi:nitrogen fixation/metabolism regulation signal transduction histidine kinase